MTRYRCHDCGAPGTRADMIVSRYTGRAYCADTRSCDKRRQQRDMGALRNPTKRTAA